MKSSNNKSRIRKVLISAIIGAALGAGTIVILNLLYDYSIRPPVNQGVLNIVEWLEMLLAIPTSVLGGITDSNELNPYILYGLLGALIFGILSVFKQFLLYKDSHET